MSDSVVPHLGSKSWVSDPSQKLSLIFAHSIASTYSQSNQYRGSITSIGYLVTQWENDPGRLVEELETALERIYGRYFDTVSVVVQHDADPDLTDYSLSFDINATVESVNYNLGVSASLKDSLLTNIRMEVNR